MSHKHCPSQAELIGYVDRALTPEQLEAIAQHLRGCSPCAEQQAQFEQLTSDLAAPLPFTELDVERHVAAVMGRLDEAQAVPGRPRRVWAWGAVALIAAAAAVLLVLAPWAETAASLRATQHVRRPSVSLQLYTEAAPRRALRTGQRVTQGEALTVSVHNRGAAPAYLLLFALDAQHRRHWLSPHVAAEGSDAAVTAEPGLLDHALKPRGAASDRNDEKLGTLLPVLRRIATRATALAPSSREQLLGPALPLAGVAPGPLRVIALIMPDLHHVAEVELLRRADLQSSSLPRFFPSALVVETTLHVHSSPGERQ
jgi:hypothetical protein